ncbi:hypothetical protein BB559_000243 [Furculomyces boomerangus]|uniref:Lysine--tRNA ligase n=2 Tax=Harpellales TaxID=61421 RepID=A0A2T9Z5X0_9FUNG|nr:hypothetical protein BB559_000243 [Furculomyces boomerangus]PVZ97176.1 hypothetical protein BB558_006869 [Smittium angustum]PWA00167.1 hypothetical protein BB558_003795 [Smittium angustum]
MYKAKTAITRYGTFQQYFIKNTLSKIKLSGVLSYSTNTNVVDKRQLKEQRVKEISDLGLDPYPIYTVPQTNYKISTIDHLKETFVLKDGEKLLQEFVAIEGRIISKRTSSKKLIFYTILKNGKHIQVVCNYSNLIDKDLESFKKIHNFLQTGDIVRSLGYIGKTNTGELSIFADQIPTLLSTCHRTIPFLSKIENIETRFRNRHVDFLVNENARNTIITRARILKLIRKYFDDNGFIEVETPVLWPSLGGALAKPFVTKSSSLGDTDLFLRISPELFLKQLVIGGIDRIYEIGKVFRNEGIDKSHSPEFTSCEFYQAYANFDDIINTTETLLSTIVADLNNGSKILKVDDNKTLDFTPPFNRINITEYLSKKLDTNLEFLHTETNTENIVEKLIEITLKNNINLSTKPYTPTRLLDNLISNLIEPLCIQPTFLLGHPILMSPLSKAKSKLESARFELFIDCSEYVNAYEELNDPDEQRSRFKLQLADRNSGDVESLVPNNDFCEALEYGLPPTSGWGMGVDRLVTLLTNSKSIREVISFPIVK